MKRFLSLILSLTTLFIVVLSVYSCGSKIDNETKERYLNSIFEIDTGLSTLDGHNHVDLIQTTETFVDADVPQTIKLIINETEETFVYEKTIRHIINDSISHRYYKADDPDKEIAIDANGTVKSIFYKYITLEIDSNASAEELQPLVERELNKWVDVSSYDSVDITPFETSLGFGRYEYCYYKYVDGYILDFAKITIHDDGSISNLNIRNFPKSDVELNIDKKLESKLLDLKLEYIFDTDTSRYKSYHQYSTPQIVTYNHELYIQYFVAADYLDESGNKLSSWALQIIIPLELLSKT